MLSDWDIQQFATKQENKIKGNKMTAQELIDILKDYPDYEVNISTFNGVFGIEKVDFRNEEFLIFTDD